MPRMQRREFLRLSIGACAIPLARAQGAQSAVEKPPFPYVDGLSFLSGAPADVAASGLTAFIADVSSVERLKTDDGSVKYFRSFEACARSLTAARKSLAAGTLPGAFLATSGSQIDAAWQKHRDGRFLSVPGLRTDRRPAVEARPVPRARAARAADHPSQRQRVGRRRDRKDVDRPDENRSRGARAVECARHHSGSFARLGSDVARRPQGQQEARGRVARRGACPREQRTVHTRRCHQRGGELRRRHGRVHDEFLAYDRPDADWRTRTSVRSSTS